VNRNQHPNTQQFNTNYKRIEMINDNNAVIH